MKHVFLKPEFVAVLSASIILTCILMIEPVIGIADNGDFSRIMLSTGLSYLSPESNDMFFCYMNKEFRTASVIPFGGGYFSTEVFLVLLARIIDVAVTQNSTLFDIRFLATLYSFMLLLSVYLIAKYNKQNSPFANWLTAGLLVLIFTDIGYIAYFNSLYGEAVSLSAMLLTTALAFTLASQRKPTVFTLIAFYLAALTLAGAKAQNAPTGILLSLFSFSLIRLRKDIPWKKSIIIFSSILVLTSVLSYTFIPSEIKTCNRYHSVFYGILKGSSTPEEDLKKLGIDTNLSVLSGTDFFKELYPSEIEKTYVLDEINQKITPLKTAFFYLKHPLRYIEKLQITAQSSFKLIQGYGSYEKTDNIQYKKTADSPNIWSSIKSNSLPHSLEFIVVFFMLYFAIITVYHLKNKNNLSVKLQMEVLGFVWLTGIIQFLIPIICDGEADLSRHLFLFNVCFDIMLFSLTVRVLNVIIGLLSKAIKHIRVTLNSNT